MAFALAPEAVASGYRLVAHETIGSTNVDAMARLRAGAPPPFWVVSGHQTHGRGRRGAAWQTQAGNLAASLALTTRAEPAVVATLGFVAGLALVRALEAVCAFPSPLVGEGGPGVSPGRMTGEAGAGDSSAVVPSGRHLLPQGEKEGLRRFRLKWPNDVLADGAKLAGILLETENLGEARAVVIGIGVNVAHAPEGLPYPAASLLALGLAVGPEELFARLSAEWVETVGIWDEGRGFDAIRDLWRARAAGLGEPISVRSGTIVTSGIFETIDGHGQLVLRTAEGEIRTVSAGEVHFGTAATARPEVAA